MEAAAQADLPYMHNTKQHNTTDITTHHPMLVASNSCCLQLPVHVKCVVST
jgi:hypothetical protein